MKPKTLEEAIAAIEQLTKQVTDITTSRDDFKTKYETVKQEKQVVVDKLFSDSEKEGMTETEKKLAQALEESTTARKNLEKQIADDAAKRQGDENTRITNALEARIVKAAKGDKAVEEKLRANVSLLEKMPRTSDEEFDAVITAGWNMLGTKEVNPLTQTNNTQGGTPAVDAKPNIADTAEGKSLASKLGLKNVAAQGEGGDDKK